MKIFRSILLTLALSLSFFNVACLFDDESSPIESVPAFIIHEGSMVDERDGQVYKTVTIVTRYNDSVTWMAQNLNFEPEIGKSFCYESEKYGRLYTWAAAVDSAAEFSDEAKGFGYRDFQLNGYIELEGDVRGVCPDGWRLINYDDFRWLSNYAPSGEINYSNRMMKSATDWNGTNEFGLNILPAGYHYEGIYRESPSADPVDVVEWREGGKAAYFWTSNDHGNAYGAFAEVFASEDYVSEYRDVRHSTVLNKYYGLSVRCVKR